MSTGTCIVRVHGRRGDELGIRIMISLLLLRARMVVNILLDGCHSLLRSCATLVFLFADTVDARTRVDVVVDRPVRALPTICQWPRDLLEAWVERKVMSNGVLQKDRLARRYR